MEPTGRTFFRALGVLVRRLIRNVRRCQFDDANPDSLMLTALFVTARIIANPVSNVFQKQRESRLHHRRHARVADAGDASPAVGVEIVLALSWCGLFINDRMSFGSGTLEDVCTWALGITFVLLLVVLPWFWDTLGHVALIGWLMAALSVLYVLFLVFLH